MHMVVISAKGSPGMGKYGLLSKVSRFSFRGTGALMMDLRARVPDAYRASARDR